MSLKCECGEKASYILFDHEPDKLVPICYRCLNKIFEIYGETNVDFYDIENPYFLSTLIKDLNESFRWYEEMLKRLRKEIDSLRRTKKSKEIQKTENLGTTD